MEKIAVKCENEEEWSKVVCYFNKSTHPHYTYPGYYNGPFGVSETGGHSDLEWYKDLGFKIISFQEFEQKYLNKKPKESKSLVGRYLKALINKPQSTSLKKGDYIKIKDKYLEANNQYLLEDNWVYTTDNGTENDWELMPEGFTPENEIPEYIKCIDSGKGYTTHSNAEEYGCINYDYGNSLTKGRVYKVINYLEINVDEWGFVLEFNNKHYLLEKSGAIKSNKEAYEAQFKKEKQYDYEVVHCITQEEWDFVTEKLGYKWTENWFKSEDSLCINLINKGHERLDFYNKENSKIYSFKEWCDKFGHKPDFSNKSNTMESILEEAKRRYPIGTKIISCSMTPGKIESHDGWYYAKKHDTVYTLGGRYAIYEEGKWAEIVSLPEKEEQWLPKVGDWVVFTSTGGNIGSNLTKNTPLQIKKIDGVFQQKGDCNAYFHNGERARLSSVDGFQNGKYEQFYRKALPHEIPVKDNTPKFQVGKWYRNIYSRNLYRNITRNEVIWSNGEFQTNYTVKENIDNWNLLEDLSEIQQYLPPNHPDKWAVGTKDTALYSMGVYPYEHEETELDLIKIPNKLKIDEKLNKIEKIELNLKQKSKVTYF